MHISIKVHKILVAFETKCAISEVVKINRRRQLEISIFYLRYTDQTIKYNNCPTMLSTSKALTSKVESGSPYRLDASQVSLSLCYTSTHAQWNWLTYSLDPPRIPRPSEAYAEG